jgi:FkbM family methyltransferase
MNIEAIVRWAWGLLKTLVDTLRRRPVRYIRLTPGLLFLTSVKILDLKALRLKNLRFRSRTESIVIDQILIDLCYDTRKLRRHAEIVEKYEESIKSGKTPLIIDCGANIGVSARWFSDQFPQAKVVCIEPSSENISSAKVNAPDADMIHAAIGSEHGTCEIGNPDANSWAFKVNLGTGAIPVLTVPDILGRYPEDVYEPLIIKIDIEGFEADLFSKDTQWIRKFFVLMVELHDWLQPNQATSQTFLRAIAQENRDFIPSGENIFSIRCNQQTELLS